MGSGEDEAAAAAQVVTAGKACVLGETASVLAGRVSAAAQRAGDAGGGTARMPLS
ncbi:hypothetical protein [[Kitasatospora] papulosa]|uniref:hypothetical protein n=1 Tax=[Kitasatospora] papulosa TaxID=1464011 RepID=UPI00369EF77A